MLLATLTTACLPARAAFRWRRGWTVALVVLAALGTFTVRAQSPAILWSTNIGARVFAVDAQTNVYANVGGSVIKLSPEGVPLQTNAVCPLPGLAQRDAAGNYYFAGTFDGTQNFGGITLMGGYIDIWRNPPQWYPGYPTCFLAKYESGGALQWVVDFKATDYGSPNPHVVTDMVLADDGTVVVAAGDSSGNCRILCKGDNGTNVWVRDRSLGALISVPCPVNLKRLSSTNGVLTQFLGNELYFAGWFDAYGQLAGASVNTMPVDHLVRDANFLYGRPGSFGPDSVVLAMTSLAAGGQVVRSYLTNQTLAWSFPLASPQVWTVDSDNQSVYVAGSDGYFGRVDSSGQLTWSTNYGPPVSSMVFGAGGVRVVQCTNGVIARLAAEALPRLVGATVEPALKTVFVGDDVTFTCVPDGTPGFAYAWRFAGTNLSGETRSTLVRTGVTPPQGGTYTVVVTNTGGAITSSPALLRVKSVQLYVGNQMLTNGAYTFSTPPMLTVRSAFPNGSAFYTLDGSSPHFTSTPYAGPFPVASSTTVRAIGYSADWSQSEEADAISVVLPARHNLSVSTSGGGILTTNSNPSPLDVNCVTPPSGIVAWWRSENNAADAVGGNAGVIYGNTTVSNGIVGHAFHFDGEISKAQVRVADAPDLHFTTAMTVEAWVKPEGGATVVSKWDAYGGHECSFRLSLANLSHAYFEIRSDGKGGGTSGVYPPYAMSASAIPAGVWTHLAGTYDGSALRVFVNGVLDGQSPFSLPIYPGSDDLCIGGMAGGTSPGYGFDFYMGMVDELALYNRALSASEILAIYHAGANGKCTTPPFAGGSYLDTDIVTLTALPFAGNTFLCWLGDATGTEPSIGVSMERDKTIRAVFGTTLGSTVAGSGQVLLDPPGGVYPYGATVRLTAVPVGGNYFGVWGNAASGNGNPLSFTVTNANPTVSSIFGATPAGQAALTVQVNGQGRVNAVPQANAYTLNQAVTLTAVPDAGQSFVNWSGDASGTQNPLPVTMSAAKVITANFTTRPSLRASQAGLEGLTPAGFRLTLAGTPATYEVLGSTNLSTWELLGSVTNVFGEVQFTDPDASQTPARFYRATP